MRIGIDCKGRKWEEISKKGCKDMTNQTYDYLTGLFRVTGDFIKDKSAWWLFKCKCGNEYIAKATEVRYGKIHSCGCYKKEVMSETKSDKLEGQKFNQLLVLENAGSNNCQKRLWKCLCDCGNITYVTTGALKSGSVQSCGCLHGKSLGEQKIETVLKEHQCEYLHNKGYFKDLILPHGGRGRYDFILLENGEPIRLIEFDGMQHYSPVSFYYGHTSEMNFEYTVANDKIKNQYALDHNIPLIRIPYTELNNITYEMLMSDQFLVSKAE